MEMIIFVKAAGVAAILVNFLQEFVQIVEYLQVSRMDAKLEPGFASLRYFHVIVSDIVLKLKNVEMIEQSPHELIACVILSRLQANQVLEFKNEVEIGETVLRFHLNRQPWARTCGCQFPIERRSKLGGFFVDFQ